MHTFLSSALRLALLVPVLLLGACTTVKPWERGKLADPVMQPGRDPLTDTAQEHVWFTREAFAGGRSIGGGGCGCN